MKYASIFAAMALALPVAAGAQASPETHNLAWHPSGKTPAASQQPMGKRHCVEAVNHHKGAKGVVTPVVRCTHATEMAKAKVAAETIERGE